MNQLGRFSLRAAVMAALFVGAASCEDSSTTVTLQLNLDRPVDVAFACYGGMRVTQPGVAGVGTAADQVITSAQPVAACDVRTQDRTDEVIPVPKGQEDLTGSGGAALNGVSYFGLILQSGPGTVALAQFPATRGTTFNGSDVSVLDADPLTPGKTSITVGSTPVAIATDESGCYAVTANAGSCDLSTLDINSALQFDGQAKVERVAVTKPSGEPINARPAAMVATPGLTGPQVLAPTTDAQRVGQVCPLKPTGYVYVAYPSCHLVAAVNASTGKIEKGILFATDGTASIIDGAAVSCTNDCTGQVATAGPHPVTLDLMNDVLRETGDMRVTSKRLAIGSRDSHKLTVVDLDANSLPVAAAPLQVDLTQSATGDLGVLDVALSPRIGMGNATLMGTRSFIDDLTPDQFQFVYAVATDGTVRVANVLNAAPAVVRECETQPDPRSLEMAQLDMKTISCLPVGPTKRRVGAIGPGIPEPLDGVPTAVSILRVQPPLADERTRGPLRLAGYFGVVTSSSGATYVIDVDDDDKADFPTLNSGFPLAVDLPTTLPHQLRDQVADRGALPTTTREDGSPGSICNSSGPGIDEAGNGRGGARLTGTFNRLSQVEVIARNKESILPQIRQYSCSGDDTTTSGPVPVPEVSFVADPKVRKEVFPDTGALHPIEDWRLVWEGVLSGDNLGVAIDGLATRPGTVAVAADGASMTISDKSRPFCAAGVEPYDTVQLRGCDPNSTIVQCPTGTTCYLHPDAATGQGACLPEKSINALSEVCRDFLVSVRRFNVGGPDEVRSGQLTLHPRTRVLRSTPLDGCTDTAQCKVLADYEARQISDLHPKDATAITNPRSFVCQADPFRKDPALKRCVMSCTRDLDCDAASACVGNVCMEGTVPPAECFAGNNIQRFDIRASDAFVVLGTSATALSGGKSTGYIHSIVDEGGKCVKKQELTPLLVGRIPLNPPPCDPAHPEVNPCLETPPAAMSKQAETRSNFDPGTCAISAVATETVERPITSQIRFANPGMVLHFVDPTYPGDLECRGDRRGADAGIPANVPTVFTGMAFTFRQSGGYSPLPIRTTAVVPVRVLRGPQQSIWIVDEGDYLTETSSVPSTRGKVFRVETSGLSIVNVMQ